MAAPIPSTPPTDATAGDTILWTSSYGDYLATAGWVLTHAFRFQLGSGKLDITATTSGTDFLSTISAAQSALLTPGLWVRASYVTLSGQRFQIDNGTLTITPNLAIIDYSTDLRSSAKIAYDNALKAWNGVTLGQTVMLNGRTYTQHNLKDLILYVDRCKSAYQAELQADQIARTGINPRKIGVRFTRV